MQSSLDLCHAWAVFADFMCSEFWPSPAVPNGLDGPTKWPRQSHPQALTEAGKCRTPWITTWARATFEQGCLAVRAKT